MSMTHYMELLATNQPWNLLLFMAIPVILAETVAITELAILFNRQTAGVVRLLNRWAGLVGGFYFAAVFAYLLITAAIPLTLGGGWRGPADVIAVGFYLLGIIPLGGLALVELGLLGNSRDAEGRLKLHATLVGIFLVTAHVAMIAGMLNPEVLGGSAHPSHA
ncbi:MAG: permease [Alphaproteobacteria bacterium]|nr:permease [Alphaproteobacteria bacterium]